MPATTRRPGNSGAPHDDHRHPHPVQTAGNLIGTFIKLTTRVQYGHYDFQRAAFFLGMHAGGNTTAIVLHTDGIIFMNADRDMFTVSGQGFINRVVHHFINQVMQAFYPHIADIHGGAFTNGLQTF